MIFIGHFSLDELGWDNEPRHGYLTCLVEAENADRAMEDFERLLKELQSKEEDCAGWKAVYIEDVIEMAEIPTRAIVTRYQSSSGEFPKSISHTLPRADSPDRVAYGLETDVEQLAREGEGRYSEMTPFIVF